MTDTPTPDPEHTLWMGKPSNWFYAGKWIFALVMIALSAASFFLNPKDLGQWALPIHLGPLAIGIFTIIWIQVSRANHSYQVTGKRVIVESGIVSKSSNEIRVQDIRSINVLRKGFSGILGIGNIEFSSAATDDADVIFLRIAQAEHVRDLVRKLQS